MKNSKTLEYEYRRHVSAQSRANKRNKVAVFDALQAANITCVCVDFDGQGDEGQITNLVATAGARAAPLPNVTLTMHEASWGAQELVPVETDLEQAIDTLCFAYLCQLHRGWEDCDGAFGEFHFDVAKRSIELKFKERDTHYSTDTHVL